MKLAMFNVLLEFMNCFARNAQRKVKWETPLFPSNGTKITCGKPWYFNRPLGKNMLRNFLSKAALLLQNSSNTSRSKFANDSARKTSIYK